MHRLGHVPVACADHVADRPVQVRIDDRNGRPRHRATLLAPVGSVIEDPASLSLFVMGGCDLVRRSGRAFEVRIDGRPVATGRLPVGWLHRRRLVKYTADPTVVVCNQAHDGPVATVDPRAPGEVEVDPRSGGIAALRARNRGHRARLELAPALPVAHLRPRQAIEGTWQLGIDRDPAVVGGFWTAERRQDVVELVLDVVQGWRPTGLPPVMAVVTRLAPCSAAGQRPTAGGNDHPGEPAHPDRTVGAHGRPARPVLPAAHQPAFTVTGRCGTLVAQPACDATPGAMQDGAAGQAPGRVVWRAR